MKRYILRSNNGCIYEAEGELKDNAIRGKYTVLRYSNGDYGEMAEWIGHHGTFPLSTHQILLQY